LITSLKKHTQNPTQSYGDVTMRGRSINPDKKIGTALTLSRETIEIIDRERGQCSRSSFVDSWILSSFGSVTK
jgi:hypothetical protein